MSNAVFVPSRLSNPEVIHQKPQIRFSVALFLSELPPLSECLGLTAGSQKNSEIDLF
jgi:hypothetical protein